MKKDKKNTNDEQFYRQETDIIRWIINYILYSKQLKRSAVQSIKNESFIYEN